MYKHFLSHKLRCYTGICGSDKSRNNTQENISYFFTCVDIANQPHLPLAPLGQVLMNERQSLLDSQYKQGWIQDFE